MLSAARFPQQKTAVELSKLTGNRELKDAVGEVLDAVLDAKVKIHDLGDENRTLRQVAPSPSYIDP